MGNTTSVGRGHALGSHNNVTKSGSEVNGTRVVEFVSEVLEESGELGIVCITGVFMLAFLLGNFLHSYHITFLPESFLVIMLGLLLGVLSELITHNGFSLEADIFLNKSFLNLVLLPVIIFEAGWSLQQRDFVAEIGYILLFAVFGTVICMLVVGGLTLATSQWHGITSPRTALAYGALISAVDPVATLATYSHLHVDPLLNIMVLGESIVNDAVAITLFKVLNEPPAGFFDEQTAWETVGTILVGVCRLLFGSIALGLASGTVFITILRFAKMSNTPALQILFVFISCFFTYSMAEGLCKLSGIITVLFCSMLMSAYATPHLTVEGRLLASFLLKQMASLADMTVFLFVGIAMTFSTQRGLTFGCYICLFCLVGRFAATFPLGIVADCIKVAWGRSLPDHAPRYFLTGKHLFMMWHAGLRGGIALVLTLEMGSWVNELEGDRSKELLRNATVVVICVFLLVFGGTTEICLKALGIPTGSDAEAMLHDHVGPLRAQLFQFHRKVMLPLLVGDNDERRLRMEGGVMEELFIEACATPSELAVDGTLARQQAHTEMRYDLFGMADPAHVVDAQLTLLASDEDRWVEFHQQRMKSHRNIVPTQRSEVESDGGFSDVSSPTPARLRERRSVNAAAHLRAARHGSSNAVVVEEQTDTSDENRWAEFGRQRMESARNIEMIRAQRVREESDDSSDQSSQAGGQNCSIQ